MFQPELWQSHDEYRTLVTTLGRKLSRNYIKYTFSAYEKKRQKLLSLNLDTIADYLSSFYSAGGRPAKNQTQILRSLVLFVLLFNKTSAKTSLTTWVKETLKNSISLTVLIGCTCKEELSPLGSYYDFMNRFWLASCHGYSRYTLFPAGKNGKKPKKTLGSDSKLLDDDTTILCKDIVSDILAGRPASDHPEAALQTIFTLLAVFPSLHSGLIDTKNLTISGDGTAVVFHASPYGKHLATCSPTCPFRKDCSRHYSDPDAHWGWDSDNKTWFFGHSLYLLCYRNNSLKVELPLLMKFTDANRHDSKNFLYTIDDFGRYGGGLTPNNLCLDSAHDNLPTYKLLEHWNSNALIAINERATSSESTKDITWDVMGHPFCKAGHKLCPWGNDPIKDAHKYRCPLKCGRIASCPYAEECSPGNYGRTVSIKNHNNLRFQPRIPRDSEQYKKLYSERTACERVNHRILNDYCLQHLRIRGKDHFSFFTMLIGICIHLDARYKVAHLSAT